MVSRPCLGKDIKRGNPAPSVSDRTGQGCPAISPGREPRRNPFAQPWVAEATSIDTPGPMVELIDTFFM